MAESGGADLLKSKYFFRKKLNPIGNSYNQVGLQPNSPTLLLAIKGTGHLFPFKSAYSYSILAFH